MKTPLTLAQRAIFHSQKSPSALTKEPHYTHKQATCCFCDTGWQRPTGCLFFIGHFPQKSFRIRGSFAERDLQLKASYASSPPCMGVWGSFPQHVVLLQCVCCSACCSACCSVCCSALQWVYGALFRNTLCYCSVRCSVC